MWVLTTRFGVPRMYCMFSKGQEYASIRMARMFFVHNLHWSSTFTLIIF